MGQGCDQYASARTKTRIGQRQGWPARNRWHLAGRCAAARRTLAVGLIRAIAAILPIGLLALGSAAVARGLVALRAAGSGFRTISGAPRRGISR